MASPVVAARNEASLVLSLACGIATESEPGDGDVFAVEEIVERSPAWQVLERRTGVAARGGAGRIVHLGIASLQRRGIAARLVGVRAAPGLLAADIAPNADADARLAGLLSASSLGVGAGATQPTALVVSAHMGSDRTALDARIRTARGRGERVWVIGTRSTRDRNEYAARPMLTVLGDANIIRGVLTSATTRTPGLISFSDVRPTLLEWVGVAADPTGPGRAVRIVYAPQRGKIVAALDRAATTNVRAMVPVLSGIGLLVALVAALGLVAVAWWPRLALPAANALNASMALPLGFLLAGASAAWPGPPLAPLSVGVLIVCESAAVAWVLAWVLRLVRRSVDPLGHCAAALAVTCLAIIADTIAGQPLMKSSLLAACGMSGIRFYGIGNEYMGILVGASLGCAFLLRWGRARTLAAGAIVSALLGLGFLGANAGGVITSVTAFGAAAVAVTGRRLSLRHVALAGTCGVAAAFVFAALDQSVAADGASHLGRALNAARAGGAHTLAEIAGRKMLMNLSILATCPAMTAVAAIGGFASLMATAMRRDVALVASAHPEWRSWQGPAMVACAAAFLFNDTGVVAALFIFGVYAIIGLYLRLSLVRTEAPGRVRGGLVE